MVKYASPFRDFIAHNVLSLVMFGLFLVITVGMSLVGHQQYNEEVARHQGVQLSYQQYLASGHFIGAVFENWESEFLQMWALVVLTIWLRQKGSPDSKKLRDEEEVDTMSRYSIIRAQSWDTRKKAILHTLYANSLGIALFSIFALSFFLHAVGGVMAANQEAVWHGGELMTLWGYLASSQFWFESFQNWQSEFLSVGALLVLAIYLRQRGSPESKPIGAPNSQTGG